MFDKLRLNKDLRKKYEELFELNSGIKSLSKYFKFKLPRKLTNNTKKEIKDVLYKLAYSPKTVEQCENISWYRYEIKDAIKNLSSESSADICLKLLNVITNNLDRNVLCSTDYFKPNTFKLLGGINTTHLNFIEKEQLNILFNILGESKDDKLVLTVLILLKNIEYGCDSTFFNTIYNSIVKANSDIKHEQLYNIFSLFWDCHFDIKNENFEKIIYALLNEVDIKFNDEKIDVYLNKIIKLIFNEEFYAYKFIKLETINKLLEIIKVKDKENNIDIILELMSNKEFLLMDNLVEQFRIINIIMDLEINDLEYKTELFKFIYMLVFDIKNVTIKDHLLNKLMDIKSIKSLEMIKDIYPFINKYTTKEDTPLLLDDIINLQNNENNKKKLILIVNNEVYNNN